MFFQGSSVVTAELWPKQMFLLASFSASMTLHFGISQCANGLTVKQNLVLVLYALLLLAQQLMKLISGQMAFRNQVAVVLVLQVFLNLGLARNLSWYRRKSWLNLRVVQKSSRDLGQILFDLIPPAYALQLIKNELSHSKILLHSGIFRVVALQLDLCGFTNLSSSLRPASLANALHKLFSDFDDAVLGRNLFKVDTIGDAYIVVGWLHRSSSQKADFGGSALSMRIKKEVAEDSEAPDDELDDVNQCADILSLAGELLEIMNRHRYMSSIPWDARIGVSLGNAVAGVLGDRQKRFSVQGEAMQQIARLEPQGKPGKAHCSANFFDLLSKRDVGKRLLKDWVVEKVVLENLQETSSGQVEAGSYLLSLPEKNNGNVDNFGRREFPERKFGYK
jgi:class 3 adenylate cyclase